VVATLWVEWLRTTAPPRVLASGAPSLWQAGPGEPVEIVVLRPSGGVAYKLVLTADDVLALCRLVRPRPAPRRGRGARGPLRGMGGPARSK
jgi:hypothetical protein